MATNDEACHVRKTDNRMLARDENVAEHSCQVSLAEMLENESNGALLVR